MLNQDNALGLVLTAKQAGDGMVYFKWTASDEYKSDEGYRLVRGLEPEPKYPGNYWFHQAKDAAHTTWIGLGGGKQHFRICQFKNNTCTAYSNNVEVDVQGKSFENDYATPLKITTAFYNAQKNISNRNDALKYVDPAVKNTNFFKAKWDKTKNWEYAKINVKSVNIGDNATMKATVELEIKNGDKIETLSGIVKTVKKYGYWWIVDFPT
jgi:hypothetical protein